MSDSAIRFTPSDVRQAKARPSEHTLRRVASEGGLNADLESPLPARLPPGCASAIFCYGSCSHSHSAIRGLELLVDGVAHPVDAQGMSVHGRPDGFWSFARTVPREAGGTISIAIHAELEGGGRATAPLAEIAVADAPPEASLNPDRRAAIAICMATFDPDPELFERQVGSLTDQTEQDWICLVSDDCSQPGRFAQIEAVIGSDPRFALSRSPERQGFYRNFERALRMVPPESELVALCDQDDRWYPEKLATLVGALGDAHLVHSDARLVDPEGRVLSETAWEGRQPAHDNLTSLMLTNTITGAASLFRRRVIDVALPFPDGPGWQFHDHWLGVTALALGEVAYVDRPLYDYVQHGGAVLRGLVGSGRAERGRRRTPGLPSRAEIGARLGMARARYFYAYVPVKLRAEVLLARCADDLTSGKRRGLRTLVSAEGSLLALSALALRPLRRLLGRGETLGAEGLLVGGIVWRRLLALCRIRRSERARCDATMPPFDPKSLEPRRWRRRQARRANQGLSAPRSGT
jgi:glycosyltransferase involved in cell wall biosynthesis